MGILRTDPDPQPSSDIIFWEGKREGEKRMGTKEEKGQTLHLSVSPAGTENQPDTTALGDPTAPPASTTASWMESLIVLVSPPSLPPSNSFSCSVFCSPSVPLQTFVMES